MRNRGGLHRRSARPGSSTVRSHARDLSPVLALTLAASALIQPSLVTYSASAALPLAVVFALDASLTRGPSVAESVVW
jgi:hypothetical protein